MNELFSQLFGQQPSYATALLGEEEARRLRQQAQQQGLLNVGLSLLAGSGPSAQPRGIGQLLAQGVQAGQQAYQGAYNKAVQERALMEQLAERRQAQADVQAAQQALQQSFVAREGGAAPMLDMTRLQSVLAGLTPGARSQVLKEAGAIQSAFAPKRITAKEGERILEEAPGGGLQQVYAVPPKPEKAPSAVQEYEFAKSQGFKGTFEQFKQLNRPVTTVNVGEGQKGLENEMKVASAFKGEPVYKAFDEMRSSYSQITTGLNAQTPAGDLTAATKFMKLLDPGSVVRESELFLAMQATGLVDKFSDYSNKIIKGTKLTESQRQDFRNIANDLYNAAANAYNTKRNEYLEFGRSQGLKGEILLGKPAELASTGAVPMDAMERARRELERRGL